MKRLLFILAVFFTMIVAYGQKYGNIWQFGYGVGLDFSDCVPVLINGSNSGIEGCSAIADSTGGLLFYTNSDSVWNRLHNVMPNGNLISSNGTLSQVIIIPKPLSFNFYYIITTKIQASGSLTLQYHEIDMTLDGNLGGVLSKNNLLSTLNITEQIAATYHNNGTDIWLMTHEYGTSNFLAYLITQTGISTTPIISNVGPAHVECNSNINARGEIKFSPDGSKLAFNANGVGGNDSSNILTLCDFDNNTGLVSNSFNLPFSKGEYGLSFSPDNSKLYGATWKSFNFTLSDYNYLYQFDLSSDIPSTIINSKQIVDSIPVLTSYGTLKIGPDGKIYVRFVGSSYLGVINSPNQTGVACNYVKDGFYIGSQTWQYGLNNYIEYTTYCNDTGIATLTETNTRISIVPNPFSTQTILHTDNYFYNTTLTVYNSLGQIVKEIKNISGQSIILSRDNLQSGLYFIRLIQDNKLMLSDKLIITD